MSEIPRECHDKDLCTELKNEQFLQTLSQQELFGLSFRCGGIAMGFRMEISCPDINGLNCFIRREDVDETLRKLVERRILADSIDPN